MVFLFPPPQGHSSFVTHVDWSQDSQYLVTNSGDYEILFCRSSALHLHFESLQIITEDNERCVAVLLISGEASCGKHVTNMDTMRNMEWATYTCTLSFSTFGGFKKIQSMCLLCFFLTSLFMSVVVGSLDVLMLP